MSLPVVAPPGFYPPPEGITPNFSNPQHERGGLLPLVVIFLTISTILLTLRLYTKAVIIKILGWEDIIITVAWLCNVTLCGLVLRSLELGSGIHMWDMTIPRFEAWSKNVYLAIIFYVPAVALPKVAILLFYLRLNPDRKFRYSVFAILALTVGYMVALDLAQIFGCSPVSKFWDLSITSGKCVDVTKIYLANPIINTIVDLLVLFIPIPMVLRLHISQRYKLCLAMLFAVGSSTVIVSAVRIWAIAVSSRSTDTTWHVTISTSLIVVESNLTVACGSVIMLRPFFQRHFPSILARFAPSANQSGPSGQSPGAKALDFERSKNSQYRTKISGGKGSNSRSWPGWSSSTAFRSHEEDEDMENLNAELKQLPASRTHFHDHHRSGAKMGKEYGNEHGGDFGYPGLGGEGRRQNDHLPTKGISDEELSGKSSQEDVIGLARGGPPPDDDDTGQRDPYRLSSKDVESGIMKTVTLDVR